MNQHSNTLPLTSFHVTDSFWKGKMELVRTKVLPYQWEALNDRVPGAAPSYCMHNFRAAARLNARKKAEAQLFVPPSYPVNRFQPLPDDPSAPEPDRFYGFAFQDTDFSKWIEAVAYSLVLHPDAELEKTADEAIEIVCDAQLENGYLDTYYILQDMQMAGTNLRNNHELYCLGHLIEGAVAYYEATGKNRLLQAACRFADWADTQFGREEGKKRGYPGHEIAEMALFRLYDVTHEPKYLKLAQYFLDERGTSPHYFFLEDCAAADRENRPHPRQPEDLYTYYQAHLPVREQREAVGHAVRAMYLYSGMADSARLTDDPAMTEACEALFHSAVDEKMYITGGVGSTVAGEAFTYPFDLPNDAAYSETCASIGLVFFARRMLQLHADSRFGDAMERALYNTVLAGMAMDGQSFFYVNPLEVNPVACHRDSRLSHVKPVRQKWFGCACCPPNIARLISSLPTYGWTKSEDTLFTHLYIAGKVNTSFQNQPFSLSVESDFPWKGEVEVKVKASEVPAVLAFRLPGWCKHPTYHCENKETWIKDGYLFCKGTWNDGDLVRLNFPMDIRVFTSSEKVLENLNKVAVMRGPVVYSAEGYNNQDSVADLVLDPASLSSELLPDSFLDQDYISIEINGKRRLQKQASLYQDWEPVAYKDVRVKLSPYYTWANHGENEMRVWFPFN